MGDSVGRIGIVPVNAIDPSLLKRLALCLEERFLLSCSVERTLRVPATSLNSVRKQLFLNTLAARTIALDLPYEGFRLAVTDYDLYKISHQFIFGEGSEEHKVAVVSLHRMRTEFYREEPDENLLFQRLLKESVHNLGHAMGLRHCQQPRCAMVVSNSIFDTDNKHPHLCETCERRARKPLHG
jgi:archaemetzincin